MLPRCPNTTIKMTIPCLTHTHTRARAHTHTHTLSHTHARALTGFEHHDQDHDARRVWSGHGGVIARTHARTHTRENQICTPMSNTIRVGTDHRGKGEGGRGRGFSFRPPPRALCPSVCLAVCLSVCLSLYPSRSRSPFPLLLKHARTWGRWTPGRRWNT